MPKSRYVSLTLAGRRLELPRDIPLSIVYEMEDEQNFEQKKGSTALNVTVPATPENAKILAEFTNPSSEDTTPDEMMRGIQPAVLDGDGSELLVGKGIVQEASHTDKPVGIVVDCYGNNADWAIENAELTLADVVSKETHVFDGVTVGSSWSHDGNAEDADYVYAPVRYRQPFEEGDTVVGIKQFRPSLFLYWLLYRGFKAAGYSIVSDFMNTEYFRRLVLPWVWGNFLKLEGSDKDVLRFKAFAIGLALMGETTSSVGNFDLVFSTDKGWVEGEPPFGIGGHYVGGWSISRDYAPDGYDNGDAYTWNGWDTMQWYYRPEHHMVFGDLVVIFKLQIAYSLYATNGCRATLFLDWRRIHGGVPGPWTEVLVDGVDSAPLDFEGQSAKGTKDIFFWTDTVQGGDVIEARLRVNGKETAVGGWSCRIFDNHPDFGPTCFSTQDFIMPIGGLVRLWEYPRFKNYKWLDLLRGTVDVFNLKLQSDPVQKKVYIEPEHQYTLTPHQADIRKGYHTGLHLNWSDRQDLSQVSTIENYCDMEQAFSIRMKDDNADGILKKLQDRHNISLTEARYQLPERFQKGKKEMVNRFFSSVAHYNAMQWKDITGVAPQLIALIPENVSNTSESESSNTFEPKLAWYKGPVNGAGGWQYNLFGQKETSDILPFMFAVNYHKGGDYDPILTYCNQNIAGQLGIGLFQRYFLQRFAIFRRGKRYKTFIHLNNSDIQNWLHREYIYIGQQQYQITRIQYKPLDDSSSEVTLWQFWPVTDKDFQNTFPSQQSIASGDPLPNSIDFKYQPLLALPSDIKS